MSHIPLIGITASWAPFVEKRPVFPDASFDYLKNEYSDSIARAGGLPVIIPNFEKEHWSFIDPLIRRLDGLLLSGGSDFSPDLFGQEEIPEAKCVFRRRRDEFELELLQRWDAIRPKSPVMAICRGHQLVNIRYGGTLVQDFDACGVRTIEIGHRTPELQRTYHDVEICTNSILAGIVGTGKLHVNSSHHQAVDKLADGFRVTARAEDGVIEAIEETNPRRWLISVQWHPEALTDSASEVLFEEFIKACKCV
jgi:putative glutamine amidotransferase